ncbi:hypothetical protein CcI49_11425 [Frankia sp. CcI49]|nr:hypothetical protein CcI49_11425 [Frankia sp. CcI49]
MGARTWRPAGPGPFPVVLCYHHGPGLGEEIYSVARDLAEEGFFAAAPDLYHREGEEISFNMSDPSVRASERERLFGIIDRTTPAIMVSDALVLIDAIRRNPATDQGPVGCIGFCHTARTVIHGMARNPDVFAAGSFMHPFLTVTDRADSPHLLVREVEGTIYGAFGGADQISPVATQQPLIDELNKLGDRAVVDVFPAANHGFLFQGTEPSVYEPEAAAAAWARTVDLLRRGLNQVARA